MARLGRKLARPFRFLRVREIPLERTLLGGQAGFEARHWAQIVGRADEHPLALPESPHVRFLERWRTEGEALLKPAVFAETPYARNAMEVVRHGGAYFGARTMEGVIEHARRFAALHDRVKSGNPEPLDLPGGVGHSSRDSLPTVHPTWTPTTFLLADGHHRLAIAWVLGRKSHPAILLEPIPTELQLLASRVAQTSGRRELYQPIPGVEFDAAWPLVRNCADRFAMMRKFLEERRIAPAGLTMADFSCSYGWFVSEFAKAGFDARGFDIDPVALRIGRIAYGLDPARLERGDSIAILNAGGRKYDVVLFLSILHHFAVKQGMGTPEEILRRVDAATGRVLFLDSGEGHEVWMRKHIPAWNPEYVADLIRKNTTFKEVVPLGVDRDDAGAFAGNYGRTLFACVR
jgi:SAM-dependent methyltransferase